jgi:HlyD family secretion protein
VDRPLTDEVLHQHRRRRVVQIALPLLVIGLIIVWLPGWMRPSIPRSRLRTARVTTGPIEAAIMATGLVVPEVERVLSSPLDARVLRILQHPGAQLEVGTAVLELDTSDSVLTLEKIIKDRNIKENLQAQSRVALEKSLADLAGRIEMKTLDLQAAQSRLESNQQLFKDNLLSREALRQSELSVKQAEIELGQLRSDRESAQRSTAMQLEGLSLERGSLDKEAAQARRLLELSTTKSDRRGVLTWVVSQEGALIHRGDVIARIADLSSFRIDGSVSDVHVGRLHTGMSAVVRINDETLDGTISEVYPTVENGVIRFTVALTKSSQPSLRPNLRADVLVITERKPRALRVKRGPFADSVQRQVFVIRGDRAVRVPVTLGLAGIDDIEVLSGLNDSDEIIISDMRDYAHLTEVTLK